MNIPLKIGISETLGVRGVIADQPIKKGIVIERCPVVLVPINQEKALFQTVLERYYFEWTNTHHVIVMGYGSLYNHSYTPNALYRLNYKDHCMVYRAIKDIAEGEEVTINYNWDPANTDPLDSILLDADTKYAVVRKPTSKSV